MVSWFEWDDSAQKNYPGARHVKKSTSNPAFGHMTIGEKSPTQELWPVPRQSAWGEGSPKNLGQALVRSSKAIMTQAVTRWSHPDQSGSLRELKRSAMSKRGRGPGGGRSLPNVEDMAGKDPCQGRTKLAHQAHPTKARVCAATRAMVLLFQAPSRQTIRGQVRCGGLPGGKNIDSAPGLCWRVHSAPDAGPDHRQPQGGQGRPPRGHRDLARG